MSRAGWLAVGLVVAPLGFAAWISFSPDSFLTPPTGAWSLRWYKAFLADHRWVSALFRSLGIAGGAAAVAVAAGGPLAFAVARYRFAGRRALAAAAVLPACVPPAVLGMGLLPVLYASGLWGSPVAMALTHGLLGLPVVFLVVRSHLESLSPDLEAAARGLGASGWQSARRVTLPLVRPAILAGVAAAFVGSLNEGLVSLFLATPSSETLPAVVWPQLRFAPNPLVAVASCLSAATAVLAVGSIMLITRARRGTAPGTPS
ncbi:MAG TPA: ABC transporter permease subunit [Gemmataceae bacterium]|nr:ABC transporter permease subunit [Gemmataceae bacterium]